VVVATITLYYELYVVGSVSTLVLVNLGMTFTFYVVTLALGNLIGASGSLFAGLTDRYGRANLVVFGLLLTGVFTEFVIPTATSKYRPTRRCSRRPPSTRRTLSRPRCRRSCSRRPAAGLRVSRS
jgi:MFS family permease